MDYVAFWRAPRFRWWKALLALLMAGFLFFAVTAPAQLIGLVLDGADLTVLASGTLPAIGPGFFLANNIGLALCIPVAMLTAWACTQQRPGWLSSVEGGVRWRWLGTLVVALLPFWVVAVGLQLVLTPPEDPHWRDHAWLMIAGILLTTPLQAAGEEYLVRGLLGRAVGSWFRWPVVGFAASAVVTSLVFMVLHGAGDPWLNAVYLMFGLVGAWVTWRTGGLEAAVAIHVVNNVVGEAVMPFIDFSEMFVRTAGVGDPTALVQVGLLLLAVAIVEVLARRRGIVRRSAPGRRDLEALARSAWPLDGAPGPGPRQW